MKRTASFRRGKRPRFAQSGIAVRAGRRAPTVSESVTKKSRHDPRRLYLWQEVMNHGSTIRAGETSYDPVSLPYQNQLFPSIIPRIIP
jgi:hypothetical protein